MNAVLKKLLIVLMLAALILVAGSYLVSIGPKGSSDILLTIEARGGLCPYGLCWSKETIYRNGSYAYSDRDEKEIKGLFSKDHIDTLERLIETANFTSIKSKKFTDVCPSAYDGQEVTYTFYTAKEVIPSCMFAIDYTSPLFKEIGMLSSMIDSQL